MVICVSNIAKPLAVPKQSIVNFVIAIFALLLLKLGTLGINGLLAQKVVTEGQGLEVAFATLE